MVEIVPRDSTKVTKAGTKLPKGNQDIIAWIQEDMPGINKAIIQHCLNFDPAYMPVQQRRRIFAPDHNQVVIKEVEKFLATSFIREVYCPEWLANVVMVKKANGKWRMCLFHRLE